MSDMTNKDPIDQKLNMIMPAIIAALESDGFSREDIALAFIAWGAGQLAEVKGEAFTAAVLQGFIDESMSGDVKVKH